MSPSRAAATLGTLVVVGGLAAGCLSASPSQPPESQPAQTAGEPRASAESAFTSVQCPDEVLLVVIVAPDCGYLTVPERHDESAPNTIRVFVIRIEPTEGATSGDAMVVVGETLGARMEYGGLVQVAQRTGRTAYIVDRRGTGLSEPVLDCPEVTAAAPAILELPSRDAGVEAALDAAVRACRSRLADTGIDVSAYGLRDSALDIEALRRTLGLDPWNVIGFGTASRLVLEVGRAAPDGVRTMILDSPVLPDGPDPMFATEASAHAIAQLAAACAAEAACAGAHPDVADELQRAMTALDEDPATIEVELAPGQPRTVVVDGARFGRAVRNQLAFHGGAEADLLLASLSAALEGRLTPDDTLVRLIAGADPLCLGYMPSCEGVQHGSQLTTACADVLPAVDRESVLAEGASVPGMAGVFETNPFFAACDAWDVPPEPRTSAPIETDVPILALAGQLDPFTGPIAMLEAASPRLSRALLLEVPNHSYNVFGYDECPRLVRRAWLDDFDRAPDTGCLAQVRIAQVSR